MSLHFILGTLHETLHEVRSGSFSDFGGRNRDVRFPPDSDRAADIAGGPFRANCGSDRPKAEHGAEWQAAMRALSRYALKSGTLARAE